MTINKMMLKDGSHAPGVTNQGTMTIASDATLSGFNTSSIIEKEESATIVIEGTSNFTNLAGLKFTWNGSSSWVANAIPATQYTLTLTGEGLTSDPVAGAIDENTSVTVTVAPAEGQQVATFTVGGEDKKADLVANAYTFTITADTEVAVTYEAAASAITGITVQARHDSGTLAAGQPSQVNDNKFTVGTVTKAANVYTIPLTGTAALVEDTNPESTSGKWIGVRLQLDGVTDISTVSYSKDGSAYSALSEDEAIAEGERANSLMYYMNGADASATRYIKAADGVVITLNFTFNAYE